MIVLISGHSFHYEMENLCRLFFHHQPIRVLENGEVGEDPILLFTGVSHTLSGGKITVTLHTKKGLTIRTETFEKGLFAKEQEIERRMGILVFRLLSWYCGIRPRWGIFDRCPPCETIAFLKRAIWGRKSFIHFS